MCSTIHMFIHLKQINRKANEDRNTNIDYPGEIIEIRQQNVDEFPEGHVMTGLQRYLQ